MPIEGCALQILRATHTSVHDMIVYLRPLGGRLPANEAEFNQLQAIMRRERRIAEHAHNNLGQHLHHSRQAGQHAYLTVGDESAPAGTSGGPSDPSGEGSSNFFFGGLSTAADTPNGEISYETHQAIEDEIDEDADISTDTSSDDMQEDIDFTDVQDMPEAEAEEHLYYQKRYATRQIGRASCRERV